MNSFIHVRTRLGKNYKLKLTDLGLGKSKTPYEAVVKAMLLLDIRRYSVVKINPNVQSLKGLRSIHIHET